MIMKRKLLNSRSVTLSLTTLLSVALMVTIFSACNKPQNVNEEILSLYDITATFDSTNNTLDCRQEVCFINREGETLDELKFHLSAAAFRKDAKYSPFTAQEMSSVYYNGPSYGGIEIASVQIENMESEFSIGGEDANLLIVPMTALESNKSINLEILYTVTLPHCTGRMGVTQTTVNLGNFYPALCVYEDGAFEEHPYYCLGDPFYTDCADYLVSLKIPENYIAATSGVVEESYVENGMRVLEINSSKTRDFAAVLSTNFKVLSDRIGGIDINYYYTKDANAQASLATAKNAIKTFSDAFGAYPFKVFNVAQTNFNSGGMEYSNLVFISSTATGTALEETIVHETAHQWWYGVVGGDQIRNAWLDEGLAEFSTAYYFRLNGDSKRYTKIMSETLSSYIVHLDFLKSNFPDVSSNMNRAIPDYQTEGEYVIMNYHKGALMYASLLDMYGEKKLNKALGAYYSDNAYQIAKPADLMAALNLHCKHADALVQSWLDGKVKIG